MTLTNVCAGRSRAQALPGAVWGQRVRPPEGDRRGWRCSQPARSVGAEATAWTSGAEPEAFTRRG